jgi:hypothetical protein
MRGINLERPPEVNVSLTDQGGTWALEVYVSASQIVVLGERPRAEEMDAVQSLH